MEPAFAFGSNGFLVEQLQLALTRLEVTWPDGHKGPALTEDQVDSRFGRATRTAVRLLQKTRAIEETGRVDAALWKEITGNTWPTEFERSLQLIAGFEGHGFTKAAGDWDGAGVTWGIIGFTLISGGEANTLPRLIGKIVSKYPTYLEEAFGKDLAAVLKTVPGMEIKALRQFAKDVTDWSYKPKPKKGAVLKTVTKPWYPLIKTWQDGFDALGRYSDVQALQKEFARTEFYAPALKNAAELATQFPALDCQQTRQLFFDIHVNNGAPDDARKQRIKDAVAAVGPLTPVSAKLLAITEVLAAEIKKHAKDIRERKGTISRGRGTVHDGPFKLDDWGIQVEELVLEHLLHLGMLSFEPQQVGEQLTLAKAATRFVNPEAAVLWPDAWPADNGTELLSDKPLDATVRSLSLRPLLSPKGAGLLEPDAAPLSQAIAVTFSRPIGILAVFGQGSPLQLASPRLLFARGAGGYAGLDVSVDGSLQLFRQRLAAEKPEAARLDIGDIRSRLASCQLILLFGSYGVGQAPAESSPARLWRQLLEPFGARPIVLGWFGGARVPRDEDKQFVSGAFLDALGQKYPNASLEDLCKQHSDEVVELWGKTCHATFGMGRQRFLWRDGPLAAAFPDDSPLATIGLSGAAGIGRDGQFFRARKAYPGQGDAMERVQ